MSQNFDTRLAGSVILFHPSTGVIQNISSYIDELSVLYIIDNSDTKNHQLLTEIKELSPKCKLVTNSENLGIASALNQAVDMASNDGFDWLLTMDQDSHFENNAYFKAFQKYEDKAAVALFSPDFVISSDDLLKSESIKFSDVQDMVMTSGSIIQLKICKALNGFENKLFIDDVDTDYCFKLLKFNYKIVRVHGGYLYHSLGLTKKIKFFDNDLKIVEHPPFRYYYITRNNFYISKKYFFSLPRLTLRHFRIGFLKKTIIAIIYQRDFTTITKYVLLGFFDFLRCKYGILTNKRDKS